MQPQSPQRVEYAATDFFIGQHLDVLDTVNKWSNGEVLLIRPLELYIHYSGWSSQKYDQYVPLASGRILKQWQPGKVPHLNNRVDAFHPMGGWLEAKIIQIAQESNTNTNTNTNTTKVKVHFIGYYDKYDLWVDYSDASQVAVIGSKSKAKGSGKCRAKTKHHLTLSEYAKKLLQAKLSYFIADMAAHQMQMHPVGGDGNCLFRAVSHQLYGTQEYHGELRQLTMGYLMRERQFFQDYVVEDMEEYVQRKGKDGVWGDDVEIQALSEIYGRPIQIYATSAQPLRTFHQQNQHQIRPIRLAYLGSCHYNSIITLPQHQPLISDQFGEYESLILSTTEKNAVGMRVRYVFANSGTLDEAIQQRAEGQGKQQKQSQQLQIQIQKALQISQRQSILEQIQKSQLKEIQNKYQLQLLQKQLKQIQQKQLKEAKQLSKPQMIPYWFADLQAQGYSDAQIWFAIEVKGYDPDAVQNFLLDDMMY